MRKKLLALILTVVMVLGMVPTVALAAAEEPSQIDGVYQIGTAEQLLWFAQEVNGGNAAINAVLTADIDMSDVKDWPGIGAEPTYDHRGWLSDHSKSFGGSFDGQGHTVTFQNSQWGLFGYILGEKSAVATVQNVIVAGSVKRSAVAHQAGYTHFTNCINRATIICNSGYVAGIVGKVIGYTESGVLKSDVLFTNCGNEASVSAGGGNAGGILGYSDTNTRINGCYNTGNIHGYHHIGGLVGYLQRADGSCYISNSYNTGTVNGTSKVGGIIGNMYNGVSVTNCYNAGSAQSQIVIFLAVVPQRALPIITRQQVMMKYQMKLPLEQLLYLLL